MESWSANILSWYYIILLRLLEKKKNFFFFLLRWTYKTSFEYTRRIVRMYSYRNMPNRFYRLLLYNKTRISPCEMRIATLQNSKRHHFFAVHNIRLECRGWILWIRRRKTRPSPDDRTYTSPFILLYIYICYFCWLLLSVSFLYENSRHRYRTIIVRPTLNPTRITRAPSLRRHFEAKRVGGFHSVFLARVSRTFFTYINSRVFRRTRLSSERQANKIAAKQTRSSPG